MCVGFEDVLGVLVDGLPSRGVVVGADHANWLVHDPHSLTGDRAWSIPWTGRRAPWYRAG